MQFYLLCACRCDKKWFICKLCLSDGGRWTGWGGEQDKKWGKRKGNGRKVDRMEGLQEERRKRVKLNWARWWLLGKAGYVEEGTKLKVYDNQNWSERLWYEVFQVLHYRQLKYYRAFKGHLGTLIISTQLVKLSQMVLEKLKYGSGGQII